MWTNWSPPTAGSHDDWSQVPSTGGGSAKERDLQAELTKTRRWAAQMQSERYHIKNSKKSRDRPRSRSRGGGKGERYAEKTQRHIDHEQHDINKTARAKGAARKGGKKGGNNRR